MGIFYTPSELMQRRITVLLLGCGGTGSEVLSGLAKLHYVMRATGHPEGLHVVVVDGDTVSPSNIGRQPFCQSDIGLHKSLALTQRYNLHYGLRWEAHPGYLKDAKQLLNKDFDLILTCVDTAAIRVQLAKTLRDSYGDRNTLWVDFGNSATTAQVVLGHATKYAPEEGGLRLPNVYDLYPELETVKDDQGPSCSVAEALKHQDLMVNRFTADCGLQLINRVFRHGSIDYHGAFIDVGRLSIQPMRIDPMLWASMGYTPGAETSETTGNNRRRKQR